MKPIAIWKYISWIKTLFSSKPISIKQLLLLAIPALFLGLTIRILFILAIPEGFFPVDSHSYFEFTHKLNNEGEFVLSEKRRWIYPIFLYFNSLLPVAPWYSVPITQHLLGLISTLGIGWSCAQVVRYPRPTVVLVMLLASLWPRMIWYEHVLTAETLQLTAFIVVLSLLLTTRISKSYYGLSVLILAFTLLAGMKGSSRFLWLGCFISLFLIHRDPRQWAWSKLSYIFTAVSFFFIGTVGKNSQGDWLALSSSLPLVRQSGEPYSVYRDSLRQQILESRKYGNQYPWKIGTYKKRLNKKDEKTTFNSKWAELVRKKSLYQSVMRAFWTDAVLRNPVQMFQFTLLKIQIAASRFSRIEQFSPNSYWRVHQRALNKHRIQKNLSNREYFKQRLAIPFGVNYDEYTNIAKVGKTKAFPGFPVVNWVNAKLSWMGRSEKTDSTSAGGKETFPSLRLKPLGYFSSLGVISGLLLSPKRLKVIALLIPSGLYIAGSFTVGDALSRYLQPVEWIGFVFVGVFIDTIIFLCFLFVQKSSQVQPTLKEIN